MNAPFHPATRLATTTPFAASDAEIIEQLKQQLDATTRQMDATSERLQLSELRVQLLEDKLRLQRIAKYVGGVDRDVAEPGTDGIDVRRLHEEDASRSCGGWV